MLVGVVLGHKQAVLDEKDKAMTLIDRYMNPEDEPPEIEPAKPVQESTHSAPPEKIVTTLRQMQFQPKTFRSPEQIDAYLEKAGAKLKALLAEHDAVELK